MRKRTIILTLAIVILAVALGACARQSQQSAEKFLAGQPTEQVSGRAVLVPASNIAVTGNGKAMTFPSGSSLTADSGATVVFNAAVSLAGGVSSSGNMVVTGPTAIATATPALYVDNLGASNDVFAIADSGSVVFQVANGGRITAAGGIVANNNIVQTGPTAATTATPALYIVNQGAAADALAIIDATTPVFKVGQAGNTTIDGTLNVGGGMTGSSWGKLTAPTAAATATPGFVVDNIGAANNAFEVRDAATPMFVVGQAGAWTGSGTGTQNNTLWVTAPTAIATATPAFRVNNQGATNDALVVEDAATPVFKVGQAGVWSASGAGTTTDDITITNIAENGATRDQFIGLPRIKLVGLQQSTAVTATTAYIDANPTGEWVEVDAGTNIVVTADTTYWRDNTNSVKIAFTNVITGDGVAGTISAENLTAEESIGFWAYASGAVSSGDFALTLDDDDGTDQVYTLPALVANTWTWVELDISGCRTTWDNCNAVSALKLLATSQGGTALGALDLYIDAMFSWDTADEETLGAAVLYDGVLSMINAETGAALAEYTDYLIDYETGNDVIVWITNQSAADLVGLVAY